MRSWSSVMLLSIAISSIAYALLRTAGEIPAMVGCAATLIVLYTVLDYRLGNDEQRERRGERPLPKAKSR